MLEQFGGFWRVSLDYQQDLAMAVGGPCLMNANPLKCRTFRRFSLLAPGPKPMSALD
jgi:hypothetical protein